MYREVYYFLSCLSTSTVTLFCCFVPGGEFHVQVVDMNTDYSFEVFVCLAVLKEYRKDLLKCVEISSVYNAIHR